MINAFKADKERSSKRNTSTQRQSKSTDAVCDFGLGETSIEALDVVAGVMVSITSIG